MIASAKHIFETVGFALGIGIGGMVNALNLPMYVIGGGVASSWDAFAPAMFKEMKFRSSIYALTSPEQKDFAQSTIITRALLGSDAGLYGAARLPMLEGFTQMEKARKKQLAWLRVRWKPTHSCVGNPAFRRAL